MRGESNYVVNDCGSEQLVSVCVYAAGGMVYRMVSPQGGPDGDYPGI